MLSLVGGAAGVLFGIVGSYLVGQMLKWPMEMSLESILVAALFSIAVGVFFGYYPAARPHCSIRLKHCGMSEIKVNPEGQVD